MADTRPKPEHLDRSIPSKWDQKTMKIKGSTEEARSINNYLESIKNKLTQPQVIHEYQSVNITLDTFMSAYQGKSSKLL